MLCLVFFSRDNIRIGPTADLPQQVEKMFNVCCVQALSDKLCKSIIASKLNVEGRYSARSVASKLNKGKCEVSFLWTCTKGLRQSILIFDAILAIP